MDHEHHVHHESHDKHAGHHTEDFLKKFWIALALSVPTFFYSEMAQAVFGIHGPEFAGSQYLGLVLGSVVFFYCGFVFIVGAYRELRDRQPGMMTLIALAIISTYIYSAASVLSGAHHDLLFELSSLIAIMLLGHWIEMRSVEGAQGALHELAKLLPDMAEVIRDGAAQRVPLGELKVGDMVLIRPGAKVPADGEIVEGQSELDESIITGESKPVAKSIGAQVIAGSINGDGSLTVRIIMIGEGTFLAGVMRLVAEAQASKSRLQMVSDRAAFYLTLIAIGSGAATFIAWVAVRAGVGVAVERLVAVLVITCPHALGLAVPLVAAVSTTLAARNGLLVRERRALESAKDIDTVIFDKTGTLTEGAFAVALSSSDESLALAAAVESYSEHPIAQAVVAEVRRKNIAIKEATDFERIAGVGAQARVEGKMIFVGQRDDEDIRVEVDGEEIGTLRVADKIREEAKDAIDSLRAIGVEVVMITGDSDDVAREVAGRLGIQEYFSRVRPEEKAQKVKLLQSQGKKVAMVGDGVNDAPALTQADIGIAIGAGTNVAIESAGIVLVKSDPRDISKIFRLSRLTYRKMIQNLFWATGYNVVAIPLAAGVLASRGVVLQPALAAVFMSASTVIVALNAILLKGQRL
ncbi:MAG TPA: copper-translocating P-type ATPase [Candidatus Paceibacterota bacterium]